MTELNIQVTIELDGERAKTSEFVKSLAATSTYRIERDELAEALERGYLDVSVLVQPL